MNRKINMPKNPASLFDIYGRFLLKREKRAYKLRQNACNRSKKTCETL